MRARGRKPLPIARRPGVQAADQRLTTSDWFSEFEVGFLVPCRGREAALRRSVRSILDTSSRRFFEVLVALDEDDQDLVRALREDPLPVPHTLTIGPRLGYEFLHGYVNELCRSADSEWLWLWNDDVLMRTQGWDEIIHGYDGQFAVLNPETNHANHPRSNCIFPVVPRRWYEVLGHFAQSNHNDTYVESIANRLGIRIDVPIFLLHDRVDLTGNNDDQTAQERVFTTDSFSGPEMQGLIERDVETLGRVLAKKGGRLL